ncbi:chondroitinase-B domain-containing protein [Pedobacter frigiditerrae]|uniref:chondroitinase-B domain-containing protein n=1 Tax=Pedobacter frigiditerrae TaxID=2530452 RepID=UPI002931C26A|nr:chondroitinase-B domain-containing protein [Pedobacter frigiditerrae]
MKKIILYLLFLCATPQVILAKSYQIKSEKEFKDILSKLVAGDEVIIANGNYTNWNIEIPNKGTSAKPIFIKAQENGKIVFSGDINQTLFKLTGDYIILSGITFKKCTLLKGGGLIELKNSVNCQITNCLFLENTVKTQFTPLVIVSGNGKNNKIDNCTFTANVDNQDLQVKITKESCPQNTLIEKNIFTNKQKVSWKNGNGGECVQIGQDPVLLGLQEAKTIVRENKFINCNGESEVISNKSSGNSYLKNYFENNDGELVMRGGHDCIIDGNTFKGGTGGIRINGSGHTITNNKISNIKTSIRLMYGMAKGKQEIGFYIAASNCIINNNQISNATTGILVGDSKEVDWTGKFDTVRYPSPVMQSIAPFDNKISGNTFSNTKTEQVNQ